MSVVTESTTTTATTVTTVKAAALAGLLTDVSLFASKEDHLPALCAVQVQLGTVPGEHGKPAQPVIVARATDRYALAEGWIDCDGGGWSQSTVLIPAAGVKQLIAVLKAAGKYGWATLTVTSAGDLTAITVDNFSTQASVICSDASFPSGISSLWGGTEAEPCGALTFASYQLPRPTAVAKRRNETLRLHLNRKSNMLVTVGENFRALVMTYRDERAGVAYIDPSYNV